MSAPAGQTLSHGLGHWKVCYQPVASPRGRAVHARADQTIKHRSLKKDGTTQLLAPAACFARAKCWMGRILRCRERGRKQGWIFVLFHVPAGCAQSFNGLFT
eukprot:1146803-Pelagomonas_calceolata.AAC.1